MPTGRIVELGGVRYDFIPPKKASMIMDVLLDDEGAEPTELEQAKSLVMWFAKGLGKPAWTEVKARMRDDADELDWDEFLEQADEQFNGVTRRPPSSSGGSSGSPPRKKPKAKR